MTNRQFNIIQDTRERNGWNFVSYGNCIKMVSQKLDEGDYTTLELLELEKSTGRKLLRVERKASPSELAINLGSKSKAFMKEMERLSEYEHPYLILEFSREDLEMYPYNTGLPLATIKQMKIRPKYMFMMLNKIRETYGVDHIFAGDRRGAMDKAMGLFKSVYKEVTGAD